MDKACFLFICGDRCNMSLLMFSQVVFLVYKNKETLMWHVVIKKKIEPT